MKYIRIESLIRSPDAHKSTASRCTGYVVIPALKHCNAIVTGSFSPSGGVIRTRLAPLRSGLSRRSSANFYFRTRRTNKMKVKITKRDLLFFFIGIGIILLIDLIWNWDNNVKSFKDGFEEGFNSDRAKESAR